MSDRITRGLGAGLAACAVLAMTTVGLVAAPTQGAAVPTCAGRAATIVGTPGHDEIHGTAGRDVIVGRGGNDDIEGRRGNDLICGNRGNDELEGDRGADRLIGGKGHDEAEGGPGADSCTAEETESC